MNGKNQIGIGDLVKTTGTKVVTVRYYEQIGLSPLPSRTAGNYRIYNREHISVTVCSPLPGLGFYARSDSRSFALVFPERRRVRRGGPHCGRASDRDRV